MTPEEIETAWKKWSTDAEKILHGAHKDQTLAGIRDAAQFHAAYYFELRRLKIPIEAAKEFTLQFIGNTEESE